MKNGMHTLADWRRNRYIAHSRIFIALYLLALCLLTVTESFAKDYTFTWSANPEPVEGYKLHYKQGGTGPVEGASQINVGKQTTYTISGLDDSTTYYFSLTAYNGRDESGYSKVITMPTTTNNNPEAPFFVKSTTSTTLLRPNDFNLTTESITQHGITWTFGEPVRYGNFVNGDYWVIDSGNGVKIIKMTPSYTLYNGTRAENGAMINPSTTKQGYDGILSGEYDASQNVAIGVSESTPLKLTSGQSLVSTISNNPTSGTNNSYIYAAAVLTCLASAPPEGTFRPGISSTTKTLHNVNSVNTGLLKSLALPAGQTRPDISTYANYFQMVWLTHQGNFLVRYMHPAASGLDNYYYSRSFADAALILNMDYTLKQKRSLLINYIQLGIDIYSYIEGGGRGWWPDGGHSMGRKWPILFAGLMLNYAPMKNIGQKSGDYLYNDGHGPGNAPSDYVHFGEDGQTFYVTQKEVDATSNSTWISDSWRTSGAYLQFDINTLTFISASFGGAKLGPWNPDTRNQDVNKAVKCRPYNSSMLRDPQMAEWAIVYSINPYRSDSSWTASYRTIGSGAQAWAGTVLAARIMEAKSLWNHNALFDYTDRYMAISKGDPDPFGYKVEHEVAGNRPSGLIGTMWDTYRKNY